MSRKANINSSRTGSLQRLAVCCAFLLAPAAQADSKLAPPAPKGLHSGTPAQASIKAAPAPAATVSPAGADDESSVNRPVKDKWALLVGISKFQDAKLNLQYSAKDATDLYNYLIKEAHFAPDHVKLLTNEQATQRRILSDLGDKWLPHVAAPDDLVLIYISTHGSSSDFDVDRDNFIIAYDTDVNDLYTTALDMQDLTRIIKRRVHSNRVALVLDACHSGATTPASKGVLRQPLISADQVAQGCGQLVISSSLPDQVSWEMSHQPNSVFTKYLIDGLRLHGTETKLGDAFQYVKQKVQQEVLRDRGMLQTPVMKCAWKGDDLRIAVPPADPGPGLEEPASSPAAQTAEPTAAQPQKAQVAPSQSLESPPPSSTTVPGTTVAVVPQQAPQAPVPLNSTAPLRASAEKSHRSSSTVQSTNMVFLMRPCRGPIKCEIAPVLRGKDLWGTMSGPQDFNDLARIVSDKLSKKLADTLNAKVVDEASAGGEGAPQQSVFKLAQSCGAEYIVSVVLDQAAWAPGTMANKYSLTASIEVDSVAAGKPVLQIQQHQLKKAPLTGDMKGGRVFFETAMATALADYLADEISHSLHD